jgi:hypothetical protein
MINGSNDNCYICGMKGHFAKQCMFDEFDFCSFIKIKDIEIYSCKCRIGFDSLQQLKKHINNYW